MKNVAIIQARMGATRLPGKVLMPLGDSCVLDYVVSRCKAIAGMAEVVVATTIKQRDDVIAQWCERQGVPVYRGEEDDVLSRFLGAAAAHKADYILRVTADNPYFEYRLVSEFLAAAADGQADLITTEKGLPVGGAVELVSYEALQRMGAVAKETRHREHVTLYAYEHPEQFQIVSVAVTTPLRQPHLRITLDTEADYARLQAVAAAVSPSKTVPTEEVIAYLLQQPEKLSQNK